MAKLSNANILDRLDDLEAHSLEICSRGIELSKITAKLKESIDVTSLLGKFQQLGLVRIVYNPSTDEEPLIQLTENGLQQARQLLTPRRHSDGLNDQNGCLGSGQVR
jgi:hypothetical protein